MGRNCRVHRIGKDMHISLHKSIIWSEKDVIKGWFGWGKLATNKYVAIIDYIEINYHAKIQLIIMLNIVGTNMIKLHVCNRLW